MRERLLMWLRCPVCGSSLEVVEAVWDAGHVMEGTLACKGCELTYPVTRGVPRMLPRTTDLSNHDHSFTKSQGRTQRSFGYQWTRFGELRPEFEQQFLWFISPPITQEFFAGKTGLDAGCGFGRHMYWAVQWGAEVIGVDLSAAVDRAFENTRHLDRAQQCVELCD